MPNVFRNAVIAAVALLSPACLTPALALAQEAAQVITVTKAANLRNLADKAGFDGQSPATFTFVVPAKTNILGASGGGRAIDTGKWPDGVTLSLIVHGNVYGGGGDGGAGGDIPGPSYGGRGGDAIYVQAPIAITISAGGSVKAGGGGGGGGAGPAGSGGGGGFPNGRRGEAGSGVSSSSNIFGEAGHYGTPGGGGRGGRSGGAGGDGGNAGMPGTEAARPGGGPGDAIRINGFAVTLSRTGEIRGMVE